MNPTIMLLLLMMQYVTLRFFRSPGADSLLPEINFLLDTLFSNVKPLTRNSFEAEITTILEMIIAKEREEGGPRVISDIVNILLTDRLKEAQEVADEERREERKREEEAAEKEAATEETIEEGSGGGDENPPEVKVNL